jgi:hypothetical protein
MVYARAEFGLRLLFRLRKLFNLNFVRFMYDRFSPIAYRVIFDLLVLFVFFFVLT